MSLSKNPNAIHLLEQNMDKIDWYNLSKNPNAIYLLEQNIDKIYWTYLSENPNAIHLLEQNIDKINWIYLSLNPNIFEIDKKQLKINAEEQAKIIDKMNIHYTLVGTETSRLCLDVLPLDVLKIVAFYLIKPKMKLLDWIPSNKLR
jgi:hydroxymethylpyrimidine pyrophosphatase-like HAD family hydrolase